VGPRTGLVVTEKSLLPLPGIEPPLLGPPACSLVTIPTRVIPVPLLLLLGHYVTSREVAGSIFVEVIGFLN
jgi:hypothetical protein